jgi:hypothetical protein
MAEGIEAMVARSWPENLRAAKGEQPHSMRGLQKWGVILEWVTFEFFLTKSQLPNGSSVIMLRSLLTALCRLSRSSDWEKPS